MHKTKKGIAFVVAIALALVGLVAGSRSIAQAAESDPWGGVSLTDDQKRSTLGFFVWKAHNQALSAQERTGAQKAVESLQKPVLASHTHFGQQGDATSLPLFASSLDLIDSINTYRSSLTYEPCRTDLQTAQKGRACDDSTLRLTPMVPNDVLMAIAQYNANFSGDVIGHASSNGANWNVAENAAWNPYLYAPSAGYQDYCAAGEPTAACGWYSEVDDYNKDINGSTGDVGHYRTLTNKRVSNNAASYQEFTLTGVAVNTSGTQNRIYGNTIVQEYSYPALATYNGQDAPSLSTATYRSQLAQYQDVLKTLLKIQSVESPQAVTVAANMNADAVEGLPATVQATYSDNSTGDVQVTWDTLNNDQKQTLHTGGEFSLQGTVSGQFADGVSNRVTVQIHVTGPTVSSVVISGKQSNETDITITASSTLTQSQSALQRALPQQADVTRSNGVTSAETITWQELNDQQKQILQSRQGGDFDVTATVEGKPLTAHIHVMPASIISYNNPDDITVVQHAQHPSLPATVQAKYSNGDTADVAVTWSALDTAQLGTTTLNGTVQAEHVDASAGQPKLTVHIVEARITSIEPIAPIVVASGADSIQYPTVNATFENGATHTVAVQWAELTAAQRQIISSREGGSFTITGEVAGPFADGSASRTVTAQVQVQAATVEAVAYDAQGTTVQTVTVASGTSEQGMIAQLPVHAQVTWSNGNITTHNIRWHSLSDAQKHVLASRAGGNFTVYADVVDSMVSANTTSSETSSASGTSDTMAQPAVLKANAVSAHIIVQPATVTAVAHPADVTTAAKVAPTLPQTLSVQWSNGDTTNEPVTWSIHESDYATRGTTTIAGTVAGKNVQLQLTVTASITELVQPADITVESGTNPTNQLPKTVAAVWSDGQRSEQSVTWDEPAQSDYAKRAGGTFTIVGTADGTSLKAQQTVHVKPATITGVQDRTITTVVHTEPKLPDTVLASYSNGDTNIPVPVRWDTSTLDYDHVGTTTIPGHVEGYSGAAPVLRVQVIDATITSLDQPSALRVESGTAADSVLAQLPATVTAHWSNGTSSEVDVTWATLTAADRSTLNARQGGTITLSGSVQGTDATVTIPIQVQPATRVSATFDGRSERTVQISTASGSMPRLPEEAVVTWSNGDTTRELITWAAYPVTQYMSRHGGVFAVAGTVAHVPNDVLTATITVHAAQALHLATPSYTVYTHIGAQPALAKTVLVVWSNGDLTAEPVEWQQIESNQISHEGSFEVAGTVRVAKPGSHTDSDNAADTDGNATNARADNSDAADVDTDNVWTFNATTKVIVTAVSVPQSNTQSHIDVVMPPAQGSAKTAVAQLSETGAAVASIMVIVGILLVVGAVMLIIIRRRQVLSDQSAMEHQGTDTHHMKESDR